MELSWESLDHPFVAWGVLPYVSINVGYWTTVLLLELLLLNPAVRKRLIPRRGGRWAAVEKVIPNVQDLVEIEMVASPLTHERFLRRTRGTYGPPLFANDGSTVSFAKTTIPGLLHCGDSCFPGIGVPSAAASGMNAANTLVAPWEQQRLMAELDSQGMLQPAPGAPLSLD